MSLLFVKKFFVFGLFLLMAFSFVAPIYAAEYRDAHWASSQTNPFEAPSCTPPFREIAESNCIELRGAHKAISFWAYSLNGINSFSIITNENTGPPAGAVGPVPQFLSWICCGGTLSNASTPTPPATPSSSAYNLQWCNVSIPNHNCTRNGTATIFDDSLCLGTVGSKPVSESAHFGCYGVADSTATSAKSSVAPLVFTARAPIPGIDYGGTLSGFFRSIYNWGIGIVGILALGQLIIAGLQYMGSGAVDTKSEAKKRIVDALVGLLLALSSILILNVVNPQTTTITEIDAGKLLSKLEAEKKAREEAAKEEAREEAREEEAPPIPTEATAARCMTYPELQNFIDNDYNCTEAAPPTPCPYRNNEPQNYFSCIAPQ